MMDFKKIAKKPKRVKRLLTVERRYKVFCVEYLPCISVDNELPSQSVGKLQEIPLIIKGKFGGKT
jgi:hypothetical protein